MLNKLVIRNYAIIDEISIDLGAGLTIITGETGAGKSIILGALSLILGQRADSKSLFNHAEKCVIEGVFDISAYQLRPFFEEHDLDYDQHTTLRREITTDGRSRSFINDTPVTLQILKQLGEQLVDIHSQHETLALNTGNFQLMVTDSICKHQPLLTNYHTSYRKCRQLQSSLEELREQSRTAAAEKDFLQYQFDELEQASIREEEQLSLEDELNTLSHAEEIKRTLGQVFFSLKEDEQSLDTQLKSAVHQIQSLEKFSVKIAELGKRLRSLQIELKDAADEMEEIAAQTGTDQERLLLVQERLDLLYRLQQKHRVPDNAGLLSIFSEISDKLQSFGSLDNEIGQKEQELSALRKQLMALAKELSADRQAAIREIEKETALLLKEVGMPDATLKIENHILPVESFGPNGIDQVSFLFSANKGYPPVELNKVASGGELSRLMLCLKSLVASHTALPTIIFDEIDTGVSGEVALKVGNVMQRLSSSLQVIAITHLPQMASKGETHLFVYKEVSGPQTYTRMKILNEEERVLEIAKMLSGDDPGANAISNAKELLER